MFGFVDVRSSLQLAGSLAGTDINVLAIVDSIGGAALFLGSKTATMFPLPKDFNFPDKFLNLILAILVLPLNDSEQLHFQFQCSILTLRIIDLFLQLF